MHVAQRNNVPSLPETETKEFGRSEILGPFFSKIDAHENYVGGLPYLGRRAYRCSDSERDVSHPRIIHNKSEQEITEKAEELTEI